MNKHKNRRSRVALLARIADLEAFIGELLFARVGDMAEWSEEEGWDPALLRALADRGLGSMQDGRFAETPQLTRLMKGGEEELKRRGYISWSRYYELRSQEGK